MYASEHDKDRAAHLRRWFGRRPKFLPKPELPVVSSVTSHSAHPAGRPRQIAGGPQGDAQADRAQLPYAACVVSDGRPCRASWVRLPLR